MSARIELTIGAVFWVVTVGFIAAAVAEAFH